MPQRAPLWMYVVAASFLAFFGFAIYADVYGPEAPGMIDFDYAQGNLHLTRLVPDLPYEKAGLRAGDRILSINGRRIVSHDDWIRAAVRFRVGVPIDLEFERAGTTTHATMLLRQRPLDLGFNAPSIEYIAWRGAILTWIIISLVVFVRPDDLSARLGAMVFGTLPIAVTMWAARTEGYLGWVGTWRSLPLALQVLLLIPAIAAVVLPVTQYLFYALFPRHESSSLRGKLKWCLPGLLFAPFVLHLFWPVYDPPAWIERIEYRALMVWMYAACVYLVSAFVILASRYRTILDHNERRRVVAVVAPMALLVGLLAASGAVRLLYEYTTELAGARPMHLATVTMTASLGVVFLFYPLPIAYAILKHRVFGLPFVIRRGLQYLLARKFLISLLPAIGTIVLFDLSRHTDQTIAAVAGERGWFYASVGAIALVGWRQQSHWLESLDKRFFRERYDAERLLRETAAEIRTAAALGQIAPRVVTRIESSLHPEFAAVMTRRPSDDSYRALASSPAGFAAREIPADSKILGLVRLLGKPLQINASDSGWLRQQLPSADTAFLRESRIDLIVPISMSPDGHDALIVLGQKRSEEPYGTEDQQLLMAIANNLALLLERPAASPMPSGLAECPKCGSCYDSGVVNCASDGAMLTPSVTPRVLGDRYRLDRRLGRGGMGTVYSAWDGSLDRRVALKLIRDDFLSDADAVDRFKREAKAAAAITHPNLVTLHDFSADASRRAFIVMELLNGPTLRQQLRQHGPMTPGEVMTILGGVCAALTAAHERGLIHRDLKPENVVLIAGSDLTPKILDFGLAKFIGGAAADSTATTSSTRAGVLLGTPRYMSPEQLGGGTASISWDLWAVAVMVYEMLSLSHPFGEYESLSALQLAIQSGRRVPIAMHVRAAPPEWEQLFDDTLAIDASRRPASAAKLLERCRHAFVSQTTPLKS